MSADVTYGIRLKGDASGFVAESTKAEKSLDAVAMAAGKVKTASAEVASSMETTSKSVGNLNKSHTTSRIEQERAAGGISELAKSYLAAGQAAEVSAGQVAFGRRIVVANLLNIGNVAVATKGDLVSMLSPVPDVVYGLKTMGVGFSGVAAAAIGAGAAVVALVTPFAMGAMRAADMASQLKGLQVGLRAVGREGELSATSLRQVGFDLAAGQGDVGRDEALAGVKALSGSRTINTGNMKAATEVARDLATALGRDLPEAADVLSKALDGGEAGLRKLNEQLRFADAAEMEHLHDLVLHGQATEATTEAIGLLRRQIGGLAEQEMGAFAKSWRDVKNAMSDFADWTSRAWRDPTLTEKIIAERRKLEAAEAELRTPGMKTTGGLNRLQGDPMAETRERAARARQALTLLERAARDEPANQAADNENMMSETASSRFSATEFARAKREREDRARILAISNPVARRQAEVEFAARKDGAARGIEGGYLDLYAKQAGRGAVDETGASARDATAAARLQAEGQERLAKAAGQSGEALRRAAVENKIAAFSTQNFGQGVKEFTQEVWRAYEAEKSQRHAEWARDIDLQTAANDNLTRATRDGSTAALDAAERENEIRAAMERTGDAYKDAALGVDHLRASRKTLATESLLSDLRDQGRNAQGLIEAQRLGPVDLGQRRASQAVDRQIKDGRITDPAQADALRRGAAEQTAFDDQLEREARILGELRGPRQQSALDLNTLNKLYQSGAISASEFATAQNNAAIRGLAASRDFADGAEEALRRYSDEAGNAAAHANRVVTGGLRSMEDGLVGFSMGTKTAAEAFSAMAQQIIGDLIRMQIQANITSKISEGITAAGGFSGLFGKMFGGGGGGGGGNPTASGGAMDATGVNMTGGGGSWWPFAEGGIMTRRGKVPLRMYSGGGIANSPQAAIFGEGSTPEAYVPVPSGRIPVDLRMPPAANDRGNSLHIAEGAIVVNAPGATAADAHAIAVQVAHQVVAAASPHIVRQSVGAVRGLANRGGNFAQDMGRR